MGPQVRAWLRWWWRVERATSTPAGRSWRWPLGSPKGLEFAGKTLQIYPKFLRLSSFPMKDCEDLPYFGWISRVFDIEPHETGPSFHMFIIIFYVKIDITWGISPIFHKPVNETHMMCGRQLNLKDDPICILIYIYIYNIYIYIDTKDY